jgi:hypothetical protein
MSNDRDRDMEGFWRALDDSSDTTTVWYVQVVTASNQARLRRECGEATNARGGLSDRNISVGNLVWQKVTTGGSGRHMWSIRTSEAYHATFYERCPSPLDGLYVDDGGRNCELVFVTAANRDETAARATTIFHTEGIKPGVVVILRPGDTSGWGDTILSDRDGYLETAPYFEGWKRQGADAGFDFSEVTSYEQLRRLVYDKILAMRGEHNWCTPDTNQFLKSVGLPTVDGWPDETSQMAEFMATLHGAIKRTGRGEYTAGQWLTQIGLTPPEAPTQKITVEITAKGASATAIREAVNAALRASNEDWVVVHQGL